MSTQSSLLPTGFEALAPFVDFWAVDTAAARAHCRDSSGEERRLAFYNAANDWVPKVLAYLDEKPLGEFDESEQRLMQLALSFAHVSLSVEVLREDESKHAHTRLFMRITRAPADL